MMLIRGLAKVPITAAFAFSTSGMMCPPMLIYPYKRIPSETKQRVPHDSNMTVREEIVGSELINRAQDKRRKNEAEPVLERQIGALEGTSSEELELPGKEQLPTNN